MCRKSKISEHIENRSGFQWVVFDNWDKLIDFKFLSVYFVNPWSSLDKKWVIYPYTHNRIADEDSLETGLKSMFEMIEPLTESMIESKI